MVAKMQPFKWDDYAVWIGTTDRIDPCGMNHLNIEGFPAECQTFWRIFDRMLAARGQDYIISPCNDVAIVERRVTG